MRLVPTVTALVACCLSLVACGGSDDDTGSNQHADVADDSCTNAEGADTFSANMSKTGDAGYEFTLVSSSPAPPGKYDNTWVIAVSDPEGVAIAAADIVVIPWMPEHGHGSNRDVIVTDEGDGTYTAERVNFSMTGVWETTIEIRDETGATVDSAKFSFCIE